MGNANLNLGACDVKGRAHWPSRTYQRQHPPAKFLFAEEGLRVGIAVVVPGQRMFLEPKKGRR
ncbi:MAG: hypothetical protein DMG22_18460 [Acidobacteria bacterium]|nr:MAG: hypothetical protein DMG22_18460 [Acidobacteriota bacterium]